MEVIKCKYPEKDCVDSYWSHGTKKEGKYCRLKEWKQKRGVCPYDKSIFAVQKKIRKALTKEQTRLKIDEVNSKWHKK